MAACGGHETAPRVPYTLGALHVDGAPAVDPAIVAALEPYERGYASRLLDISDDGARTLVLTAGNVMEQPGNHARITDRDAVWAQFSDAGIVDDSDLDGDEEFHLAVAGKRLTKSRAVDPILDRPRKSLVWVEVTGEHYRMVRGDSLVEPFATRAVFADEPGAWQPLDLAGDDVLARNVRSESDASLHRFQVGLFRVGGKPIATGATIAAKLGPAGQIYAVTDRGGDRMQLVEYTKDSGALEPCGEPHQPVYCNRESTVARVVSDGLGDDVEGVAVAVDGTLAFSVNHDGASKLYLDAGGARREARVPASGVISDLAFARGVPVLAFSYSDATHPREVFAYDLRTDALVQVTRSKAVPAAIEPSHEAVVSGDGVRVPMLVYAPASARGVVIQLHGGPEDQWRPRYQPFEQFLVARGYAVIEPNVRGSTGYGRAFAALDDGPNRGKVLDDVRAVVAWAARYHAPIVVMGTSYGGFLALASLIAMPDQLRGAIDMVGIADLAGFLAGTADYRRDQRRAEYGDERDPKVRAQLDALSPLHHAGEIRRPILVAAGARDPRVPPADAAKLVAEVRSRGIAVWSLVADDEGHGFAKPANRQAFEALAVQFLDTIR